VSVERAVGVAPGRFDAELVREGPVAVGETARLVRECAQRLRDGDDDDDLVGWRVADALGVPPEAVAESVCVSGGVGVGGM
jgi:hypothetical protein